MLKLQLCGPQSESQALDSFFTREKLQDGSHYENNYYDR